MRESFVNLYLSSHLIRKAFSTIDETCSINLSIHLHTHPSTPYSSLTLGTLFTHWEAPTRGTEFCGHLPFRGEGQCEATEWPTCFWRLESELGPGRDFSLQTHPSPWTWLQPEVAARSVHIRPTPSWRRLRSSWQQGPLTWAIDPTPDWGRWPLLLSPQWAGGDP